MPWLRSSANKVQTNVFCCCLIVNYGVALHLELLKGQCPDYAHARASSVFSSKDNRTVKLTRQDFLPDRTADRDLLFIFSSNITGGPNSRCEGRV